MFSSLTSSQAVGRGDELVSLSTHHDELEQAVRVGIGVI